jgi:hypothetical protein
MCISLAHPCVVAGLEAFAFVLEIARASGQRTMDRDLSVRSFDMKRSRCRVREIRNRSTRRDRMLAPDFHLRGRRGLRVSGRYESRRPSRRGNENESRDGKIAGWFSG